MTTSSPSDGYVVLINTFTVDPSRAEALLAGLLEATEKSMRSRRGFVWANLHLRVDRRHVTNDAQWRRQADIDVMKADPAAQAHMKRAAEIATSFDPIYYELSDSVTV